MEIEKIKELSKMMYDAYNNTKYKKAAITAVNPTNQNEHDICEAMWEVLDIQADNNVLK